MISFTIHGKQITQGSKLSHALYGHDGKPVVKNGRVITVTRNDNENLDNWRQQVASVARAEFERQYGKDAPLLMGPIQLSVSFFIPRPKGHFGTGRNSATLKPSAPKHHIGKPDSLKLTRAIEDALSGVVYGDDSQICFHDITKHWGASYMTVVIITEIDATH